MTVTAADLVERTRRHLRQVTRERINVLNTTMSDSVTSCVVVNATPAAQVSDYIAVDYEVMLVTAVSSTTFTVIRGMLGTTAAAHTAGAQVEIGPRFPRGVILAELADELRSWPNDLYRAVTTEVTWGGHTASVELPVTDQAVPRQILSARRLTTGTESRVFDTRLELVRGTGTTWPSGYGLRMLGGQVFTDAVTLFVTYAANFNVPSYESFDDTTVIGATGVGLAESMMDIPAMGAAWRVCQGGAVERVDQTAQGQTRKAEEVKAIDLMQLGEQMMKRRDRRISDEIQRLRDLWGVAF